jgi:hypothetical protein
LTLPQSINDKGSIAGYYCDSNNVAHGFVRAADGTITTFDPSGSFRTIVNGINAKGSIVGNDSVGQDVNGFVRAADGTIKTFDVRKAIETLAVSVTGTRSITGSYEDRNGAFHGYLRSP